MKLQTSKLCVNCESLYEGISPCPYCRSEIFLWLNRALGTTLESNMEQIFDDTLGIKEGAGPRPQVHPSVSPRTSSSEEIAGPRFFAEFHTALSRLGRETVRFLTLGMIQACK
jgi:hypothetical protein